MKRIIKIIIVIIIALLLGAVLYRQLTSYWPREIEINKRQAEQRYEKDSKEDKLEFEQTPLATAIEYEKAVNSLYISKSYHSGRQGEASKIHAIVDKESEVLPIKAKVENYYLRFGEDNNMSCLYITEGPIEYQNYKAGKATAYSAGLKGVSLIDSVTADVIAEIQGKKVLVKDIPIERACSIMFSD